MTGVGSRQSTVDLRGPAPAWGRALALAAALAMGCLAAGCLDPWREVSYVEGLRVLAVRAEPPDLAPGQSAALDALVVDPTAPGRVNTVVWLACDPDPASLEQPACAKYETIEDVGAGSLDPLSLPEGLHFLGFSASSGSGVVPHAYGVPATFFDDAGVPAGDPRRTRGMLAIVLMAALATEPPTSLEELAGLMTRVQNREIDSLIAIKRVRISENPEKNRNPKLEGVRIDGVLWPPGLRPAKLVPGVSYPIQAVAAEGSAQSYTDWDVDGNAVVKEEPMIVSYFSTLGSISLPRALISDTTVELYLPVMFERVPADRRVELWLVLRDGRGGADTMLRGLYLCEPGRAAPTIASVTPASGPPGSYVEVRGEGLDDILDVSVGSGWLAGGHWDASAGAFVGSIPSDLVAGIQPVVVRGKGCVADPVSSFEVTEP